MKQKNKKMPESVEYASYDDNKIPVNNPILNYIYNHTEFKLKKLSPYLFFYYAWRSLINWKTLVAI